MPSISAFLDEKDAPSVSDFLDEEPEVTVTQPEGGDGFLAKVNAALRKPSPAWLQAPEQAARELVTGMIPHDIPSYLESIYPPAAAARAGANITQGDFSGIPFVGRVPEIMEAEETPAGSKERYLAAMKTLMDVGMLAGAGERAPIPLRGEPLVPEPPPTQGMGPGTIAGDVSRALERRFTLQEPPPEPPLAPPPPIEDTLANIPKEPPVFNPELGPQTIPEFQMPLRTEGTQQLSPIQRNGQILAKRQELLTRQKDLKQRFIAGDHGVAPELEAVEAQINNPVTNPVVHAPPPQAPVVEPLAPVTQPVSPEGPVNAPGGATVAPEAPGGVPVADIPLEDARYANLPETFSTKNAVTEQRREALNLDPVEKAGTYDFGPAWDASAKIMADDPAAGERLAKAINQKPQAVDPTQNALLLRNEIAAETEHAAAVDAVNTATDPLSVTAAQERLAAARERVQTAYDASAKAGSATGAGLNARKMMADREYNLARMEATVRAAKNGEPLSPPEAAKVKALHDKLANGRENWYKSEAARQAGRRFAQEAVSLLDEVPATRSSKGIVDYLDTQAAKARQRIIERRGRLNTGLDPTALTDEIIIGASHVARGLRDFGAWSRAMVTEFGERIRPFLRDIYERARALHEATGKKAAEGKRLETYKKGLFRRTEELRNKIEAKDLVKAERQKTKLDREAMQMRGEYHKTRAEFDQLVERERLKNRSRLQKATDTFVAAERAMKLSGVTTLGKIGSAGVTRLVTTPIERAVGAVLSRVPGLARIAREAPTEGRPSLAAEIEAARGVGRGIKQTGDILRGDKPTEEAYFSERTAGRPHVKSWLDIPGRVHGAIKNPVRASEYARAKVEATKWAERKGLDPTDPQVEQQINEHATQSGSRAIFMQDNLFSSGWNSFLGYLEGSKKFPTGGYVASRVGRFLLPIVKVPTNVAFETATHLGGLASGTGKLMQVMARGIKTIRPEEADMIMRHYKKGMVGAGLFLTGYFNAKHFGGYYHPGQKPVSGEPRFGEAEIMGVRIPKWLLHAPAALVMQAGASFYKDTHGEKPVQKPKAAIQTANEIIHEIPFFNEISRVDKMLASNWEGERARGDLARSTVVPQVVKNISDWTTPKDTEGYPLRRYPQNFVEQIKMGIPGLRELVPTEKPGARPPPTISQQIRNRKAKATRDRKKHALGVP